MRRLQFPRATFYFSPAEFHDIKRPKTAPETHICKSLHCIFVFFRPYVCIAICSVSAKSPLRTHISSEAGKSHRQRFTRSCKGSHFYACKQKDVSFDKLIIGQFGMFPREKDSFSVFSSPFSIILCILVGENEQPIASGFLRFHLLKVMFSLKTMLSFLSAKQSRTLFCFVLAFLYLCKGNSKL